MAADYNRRSDSSREESGRALWGRLGFFYRAERAVMRAVTMVCVVRVVTLWRAERADAST
jgi:hypothetical protein